MTQRKSSGKRSSTAVEVEEDDSIFTQPTTSQVQKGMEKLTKAQIDEKTTELVQYILMKDQKKIPVKRADIVKNVLKEYKNVFQEIMNRAQQRFEQVFGFKLVEIDAKNHVYILINKLEPAEGSEMISGNPKTGLLFVILSLVYMKGGVVPEGLVWNTLKKMKVDLGERHPEFGDVKKLVTDEFVRQRYLEYTKVPHTEPVKYVFTWGQRAEVEVSKIKILEFLGELHSQDPQHWSQQYKDASSQRSSRAPQPSTSSQC
ncbi:necdin-like 2 [Gadus macrocephalus]|uniref:necdin-like 2 n=1 Tax=Gadus macrocephalus TaxID=80720 RepID=UPI0028CB89B5|nr:necdin-like 2 [Gadus macrocephalus]